MKHSILHSHLHVELSLAPFKQFNCWEQDPVLFLVDVVNGVEAVGINVAHRKPVYWKGQIQVHCEDKNNPPFKHES